MRNTLKMTMLILTATLVSSCTWVNAAGRVSQGIGTGLEKAAQETPDGTISKRFFKFSGGAAKAVGTALVKGVKEDKKENK